MAFTQKICGERLLAKNQQLKVKVESKKCSYQGLKTANTFPLADFANALGTLRETRQASKSFWFLSLLFALNSCTQPKDQLAIFNQINQEVLANSRAYQTLEQATSEIGHRLTGSENGAKAEELALSLFKEYGFSNARYQKFEVEAWSRESVSLSVVEQRGFEISFDLDVVSLAHSPVEAKVEAELVDVGNGLEADFEKAGDNLQGKVALANIEIGRASCRERV